MHVNSRLCLLLFALALSGCQFCSEVAVSDETDCQSNPLAGDGVDNDGDGVIDEGCACDFDGETLGVCGQGSVDGQKGICLEPANYYAVEIYLCDGLDNNCDGLVDQGCRCEAMGSNVGVCALGRVDVSSGACIDSPLLQATESQCDGYDNDCDGATDEDCQVCDFQGSTQGACAFGVIDAQGVCKAPLAYLEDEVVQCAQDPLAGDGVDNDCDGVVDEGCACDYLSSSIGVCSLGQIIDAQTCGAPSNYEGDETSCDGLDNDCDGQVDEGCDARMDPPMMSAMCGITPEVCDGVDNNCDGIIDEGCDMPTECVPTSTMEICDDQLDNNCDGQIDEECSTSMGPVERLSASSYHTCAITRGAGEVWCWGWNSMSARSLQGATHLLSPRRIGTLTGVQQVATGGSHDCAVKTDGTVWCWGRNDYGQLGDGTQNNSEAPVQVQGLMDAEHVELGIYHGCARTRGGSLWCWGWNAEGQLGDGTGQNRSTPVQVQDWMDVTDFALGDDRTCAVRDGAGEGTLWCMGSGGSGLLGDGMGQNQSTPVQVRGFTDVTSLVFAPEMTCVGAQGGAWCWGVNTRGQLGDGTTENRETPVKVLGITQAPERFISGLPYECDASGEGPGGGWSCNGSASMMCALIDEDWWCWGRNDFGQLGRGSSSEQELMPAPTVYDNMDMTIAHTNRQESCGVNSAGEVRCWGRVTGVGATGNLITRQQVPVVTSMVMGETHTCAVGVDGDVWCWSTNNAYGQMGDGTTNESISSVRIN